VFGIAIALSFTLRGAGWLSGCLGHHMDGSLALCLSASCMMMVQSVGIRSFLTENFYDYRSYSLYGMTLESATDSIGAFLLMFFVFGVLPAIAEGILFRGFVLHEYRYGGVLISIGISSFLYAMTGMSLADLPVYFINGVLLSAVVFLTGNLFYSVLSHSLYVLFVLSLEKYIFFIALETRILIFLVLVMAGLLSAVCFCGSAEKLLRQKGENEARAPIRLKKGKFFVIFKDILSAPMLWADAACFLLICVLHILLDA
jgi:membrane protease YdiL (CAAX protease family)